jgi:hypothetical protein
VGRLAGFGDVYRVVYGSMVRYSVEKQDLIEGQPNENANSRIDPVGSRPAQLIQVPVKTPLPPHYPIYELGQQCPVPLIELRMTLQGGADQTVGM